MRKTRLTDEQIVGLLTPAADGWRDSQPLCLPIPRLARAQSRASSSTGPVLASIDGQRLRVGTGLLQVNPTAIVHAPLDPEPWTAQMAAPAPGQQRVDRVLPASVHDLTPPSS